VEEASGAVEAVAAEPPEQLLCTATETIQPTEDDPQDEEAGIHVSSRER
jgi:hypothetical protein